MGPLPITANATFCATLVDSWIRSGMTAAFVAPGSRSTPLALALADRAEISLHVLHDERAASFAAIGHGLETGTPAVVLCSSGTAGAHFYGAVIEADLSAVPMLVCTADRPPELWDRGAPQTINQTHLYGQTVRRFLEPGAPDDTEPDTWRGLAADAYSAAVGNGTNPRPGPVHLNLSFRDPLTGSPGDLPPWEEIEVRTEQTPQATALDNRALSVRALPSKGVIVAGRGQFDPDDVTSLAQQFGWPILADHRSGCRSDQAISHYDSLLRDADFAERMRPDIIVRLGEIVSSKALSQWITKCGGAGTAVLAGRPWDRYIDPEAVADETHPEPSLVAALLATSESAARASDWQTVWTAADATAKAAIADVLAHADQPNDISVARTVVDAVPAGGCLVVASSMPVRDVEWFGPARTDIDVYSNRGANGIDGTISTAIGVAATGRSTVCLVGDVAFLHDSTALIALARRTIDLTIVVTDNDGGGIFSFLPQNDLLELSRYEQLFGTPHGTDLAALATAHGIPVHTFPHGAGGDVGDEALTPSGVRIVIATTNRVTNRRLHEAVQAAVQEALHAGQT